MSIPPHAFHTHTSRQHPHGDVLTHMLAAATHAADPHTQIHRTLQRDGQRVCVAGEWLHPQRITLIAVGKAALRMAYAAGEILGDMVHQGVVVYKDDDGSPRMPHLAYHAAGHPVPTAASVQAAQRVQHDIAQTTSNDLIIVLLSGGGSALMVDPMPGISLIDIQQLTTQLLASGADIHDINTIRRRIDRVKGGGLLRTAGTTPVRTLVLSDVIGNNLTAIASGPTIPNEDPPDAAWRVIQRFQLDRTIPSSIAAALQQSPAPLTTPWVPPHIIGDIGLAMRAAQQVAEAAGFTTITLTDRLIGEARHVGTTLASIVHYHAQANTPCCLLAGGETTVTLDRVGTGGRNQELALALALGLESLTNGDPLCAAYATDGGDGPTDAAGAMVDRHTSQRARAAGMNPHSILAQHDSYHFFATLDDLLRPGPTGTNVNDLFMALMTPKAR